MTAGGSSTSTIAKAAIKRNTVSASKRAIQVDDGTCCAPRRFFEPTRGARLRKPSGARLDPGRIQHCPPRLIRPRQGCAAGGAHSPQKSSPLFPPYSTPNPRRKKTASPPDNGASTACVDKLCPAEKKPTTGNTRKFYPSLLDTQCGENAPQASAPLRFRDVLPKSAGRRRVFT